MSDFVTCGLLTTSICSEVVKKKNSNNSLKTRENSCWIRHGNNLRQKQNSCQQHQAKAIYQHMDEWENAGRSGPVEIRRIHTKKRRNISKGSKFESPGTGIEEKCWCGWHTWCPTLLSEDELNKTKNQDQTDTNTVSQDKASNTMEKQPHQFSYKD